MVISPDWATSSWCKTEDSLPNQTSRLWFRPSQVGVADRNEGRLPADRSHSPGCVPLNSTSSRLDANLRSMASFSQEGLRGLKARLTRLGVAANLFEWPPADDPGRPPYRGLRPLETDDAGTLLRSRYSRSARRSADCGRCAKAISRDCLSVLGASGAGWFTFLRASPPGRALQRDDPDFPPAGGRSGPVARQSPVRRGFPRRSGSGLRSSAACEKAPRRIEEGDGRRRSPGLRPLLDVLVEPTAPKCRGPRSGGTFGSKPPMLVSPWRSGRGAVFGRRAGGGRNIPGVAE